MTVTLSSVDEIESTGTSTPGSNSSAASLAQSALRNSEFLEGSGLSQMTQATNDDDYASDISMAAETDDSDDDSQNGPQATNSQILFQQPTMSSFGTGSSGTGQKRKMSSGQETIQDGHIWTASRGENHKRIRIEVGGDKALMSYRDKTGRLNIDRSLLPAEIWHHIFTFTPPRALGRSLQVNKVFRAYLEPSPSASPHTLASLSMSVTQIRTPEAIWQASRRVYNPGMPSPLQGFTELEMWKLALTTTCQFCNRKKQPTPSSADQWHSGPGEDSVRTIWPFAIRACGPCVQQRSVKEIDLLLSSSVPSLLITALPFAFLTNDLNVISSANLQQSQVPSHIQITKYFLQLQVDEIKSEFFKVKTMGSGTAEEWLKGLDERGKERRNDASRWERWEAIGGVQRMHDGERSEVLDPTQKSKAAIAIPSNASSEGSRPLPGTFMSRHHGGSNGANPSGFPIQLDQLISAPFSTNTPPRFDSPAQNGLAPYLPRPFPQLRHERTKEEVVELKAARRGEIERRCMMLDPPLTPAVLSHMGSFQAAIQIIKPLDDSAWEVLKPRLLSQREEAEQRENELVAQTRIVQEKYDERRQLDVHLKEVKDVNDREWDDIQAPLRARIGGYADEIIKDGWHGGEKVTKESSPRFAADVLIYVRKRFYAEVAKDEAAARAAGHEPKVDPPNGPYTQKLILENMKWIFDTKIKPLTEQYSKELFLCNGCENNFKFYGFEGVIQHYAAKHTSALSVGSIVVHWRAEWPEYPPFNPDPGPVVTTFHSAGKPTTLYANGSSTSPHIHGFGGYPPVSGQVAAPTQAQQHPAGYQQNPLPYYGHPQFGEQFSMAQTGSFVQAPAIQGQSSAFQAPPYQGSHAGGYQPYPGQGYPVQGFDGQYPSGAPMNFESPHPSQVYPVLMAEQSGQVYQQAASFQAAGQRDAGQHNAGLYVGGHYNPGPRPVVPVRTEEYKAQLQEVAQSAREIWNHITGVKDMLGSVRVHVILYHILKRYRTKYPDDPPLAMLIDGLSNNKDMRPVRNVNGLACRACKLERTNGGMRSYKSSSKGSGAADKKLFSLPQLLNHFQLTHIDGIDPPVFNWTQDMVELPDKAKMSALGRAQGMDEHKMLLIQEALPDVFRISPPPVDYNKSEAMYPVYMQDEDEPVYEQLAQSRDDHHKYYMVEPQGRYSDPDRDQYDRSEDGSREMVQDSLLGMTASKRHHLEDQRSANREHAPMAHIERRPASPSAPVRAVDEFGRHVAREARFYASPADQRRTPDQTYQDRRGRPSEGNQYDDQAIARIEHGYVSEFSLPRLLEMTDRLAAKNGDVRSQLVSQTSVVSSDVKPRGTPVRPVSHTSLPARNQQPSRADPVDAGSEDGELRTQPNAVSHRRSMPFSVDAENAALRFLNGFQSGRSAEDYATADEEAERRNEEALRANWEHERIDNIQRIPQPIMEQQRRPYDRFDDEGRSAVISMPPRSNERSPEPLHNRPRHERTMQHIAEYDYDDRYVEPAVEAPSAHPRSPEINEYRHRMNNVIYRDERPVVYGSHPAATRFSRYESVRVDNERGRSRSPLYVKLGAVPTQYREQSPPRYPQQEPLYRTRTPQASVQDVTFERFPRPEYYRVYAEEPRQRQTQHEAQVEYVQVADLEGDYLIRRPVRRDAEPIYATYNDGFYATRPTVHETRAPVSRSDPAYYEEYDPRHPAPPPSTTVRQVRYQ